MSYAIEQLFVSKLYYTIVSDYQVINNQIEKRIDEVDFQYTSKWGKTHLLSGFGKDVIKKHRFDLLSKVIDKHLENYCSELNFKKIKYNRTSWISKFSPGDHAHVHSHSSVDIAGVYYYKTNKEDGYLYFQTPNPNLESSLCYADQGQRWRHFPEEGKLLLFPGWLKHGVTTNETEDARMSISFNILFHHDAFSEGTAMK